MAAKSDVETLGHSIEKDLAAYLSGASKSLESTALAVSALAGQLAPNNSQVVEMLAALIDKRSEPVRLDELVETIRDSIRLGLADATRAFEETVNSLPLMLQALMNNEEKSLLDRTAVTTDEPSQDFDLNTDKLVEQLRAAAGEMIGRQKKLVS
jgi:hypothetical protein